MIKKITPFLLGQPASQLLSLFTGLFLVNQLGKSEYAYFGVVFAIQSAVAYVCDMGLTSAVVAIGGREGREVHALAALEKAVTASRVKMQKYMLPVAVCALFAIFRQQNWNASHQVFGFVCLIAAVYLQKFSVFQSILIVQGRLAAYYKIQIVSNLVRFGWCYIAWYFGFLNGPTACVSSVLILLVASAMSLKSCTISASSGDQSLVESFSRELARYQKPLFAVTVFSAFQSQITTLLAGFFAAQDAVADVAAFGRLAQIFAVVSAFNGNVIAPSLAAAQGEKFIQRAGLFVLVSALGCVLIIGVAWICPSAFLLVLGKHYQESGYLVFWFVFSSCIGHFMNVAWTISSSKLWASSLQSWLSIGLTLIAQVAAISIFGVRDALGAILCGFFGAAAGLIVNLIFCGNFMRRYRLERTAQ